MDSLTGFVGSATLPLAAVKFSGAHYICEQRRFHARTAAAPLRRRRNGRETPMCRTRRKPRVEIDLPESLDKIEPMMLIDGTDFDFAQTKGKAILAVNVATQDQNAEQQFASLHDLHKRYGPAGLLILAFPSNWFGQYEPGSDEEIVERLKEFNVKFTVFSKLANFDIEANPVFELGISAFPGDIMWNFEGKFLFDKRGQPIARFDLLATDEYIGSF